MVFGELEGVSGEMPIFDNFKPENYLGGFDDGRSMGPIIYTVLAKSYVFEFLFDQLYMWCSRSGKTGD